MKKIVMALALAAGMLTLPGCLKEPGCEYNECANGAPQSERDAVAAYLGTINVTNAVEHCSGVFYVIEEPGTGGRPDACTTVRISYKGTFTNGSEFDANPNFVYNLSGLIRGWRNTVPLLKVGGKMRIYVPPSLGYGADGFPPDIPGNAILVFEMSLLEI